MHSRRSFLQQSLLAASSAGFSLNSLAKAAEISAVPQSSRILVGFGAGGGNYAPRAAAPAPSRNAPSAPAPADGGFADIDDDIPF